MQSCALIGCLQHRSDLIQSAAEAAELDDAQQRSELAVGVVPVAGVGVDISGRQNAYRVVVTQHPDAHPPDRGEFSDGVHVGDHVRP